MKIRPPLCRDRVSCQDDQAKAVTILGSVTVRAVDNVFQALQAFGERHDSSIVDPVEIKNRA
jgi:hypothetical protein